MYRKTIEHPDYLPVEIRKHTDFEGGKGMGRIYRIVRTDIPAGAMQVWRMIDWASLPISELCRALNQEEGWRRSIAQRLLLERRDPESVPLLIRSLHGDAYEAVHAMRLLETLGKLDNVLLGQCLKQAAAPVREVALEIAESRLAVAPELLASILALADDRDPRVRFQSGWLFCLRRQNDPGASCLADRAHLPA